mgnify:CR=1 FL=1
MFTGLSLGLIKLKCSYPGSCYNPSCSIGRFSTYPKMIGRFSTYSRYALCLVLLERSLADPTFPCWLCMRRTTSDLRCSQMRLATSKRVRTGGPCAGAPAAVRWGTRRTSGTYIQGENGSFCEFIGEGARSPPPSVRCCVYRAVRCHSSTERRSIDPLAPTEHHRPVLGRFSAYYTACGKCQFLGRKSAYPENR